MARSIRRIRSNTVANVSGVWTQGMAEAFASLGLDLPSLCVDAALDVAALTDPRGRLPRDWAGRLWRAALQRSDDPFLGLHAAEVWEPRTNHLVWLLFLTAETFGRGLEVAVHYQSLLARGQVVTVGREGEHLLVQVNRVADELPITDNQIEYLAGVLVRLFRFSTDGLFRLQQVRFDHPYRGGIEHYEALFGCPAVFDCERTELVVGEEVWGLPLAHGNRSLHDQLTEMAETEYSGLETQGFAAAAKDAIRALLSKDQYSIDAVALVLHVTPRTLQRRLREDGTSFRVVLDEARKSIVLDGLTHRRSPEDLARAAGFTNPRSFRRAMKRWGLDGDSADSPGQ